jgi:Bacterial Ig-like domain/WD40-like Beta Propeller Repeat
MRAVILRSVLVIAAGGLVLAGVLYVASTVDARPPEVLTIAVTQPVGGDAQVALITTSIEVAFSEPVDESAAAALSVEPDIDGATSWSGSTLIFTPDEALALEAEYAVSIDEGIRDRAGNEMSELPPPFTFRTAGRPTVVETEPVDGAADVATDAPLSIRFSSLMDTASVEVGLRFEPAFAYELRWSGELLEIIPSQALRPDREYELLVDGGAADVAGVALGEPVTVRFRTIAPGVAIETLIPADEVDGISPMSPIAVVFDRPIDPESVDGDALTITPDVAGTLEVAGLPGDPVTDDGAGRVLRFTPSAALPATTTFEIELATGVSGSDGGGLAGAQSWTFTTGAGGATVSNQITFVTDRAGVANVWTMNADGTGQRQVSAELAPVVDYAVAPDGTSLVVGDGRRLVYLRADGSDRRVLTREEHWEVDPTFAPDGQHVAFARVDAAEGAGLGLWEWRIGGGAAEPIDLPAEARSSPEASPSGTDDGPTIRAPRYGTDGAVLAFVDLAGWVGLLERADPELSRVPFAAAAAPIWLADGSAVLLTGSLDGVARSGSSDAPISPLEPGAPDAVYRLGRSAARPTATALGPGYRVLAVAPDGTIAYATDEGALGITTSLDDLADAPEARSGNVVAAAFAPGEASMVIEIEDVDGGPRLELVELDGGRRTPLVPDGSRPRWLP